MRQARQMQQIATAAAQLRGTSKAAVQTNAFAFVEAGTW